jgi:hypothetical protein
MIEDNAELRRTTVAKYSGAARVLFGLIRECLVEMFGDSAHASREQLDAALQRVNDSWPQVESLFDFAYLDWIQSLRFTADSRRKDGVTRILIATLAMTATERGLPHDDGFYRKAAPFLQRAFWSLASASEWKMLNELAQHVFLSTHSDRDDVLIPYLRSNTVINLAVDNICINLATRFTDLPGRQADFLSIMAGAEATVGRPVTADDFMIIFESLFLDYCEAAGRDEDAARLELFHGREKLDALRLVHQSYIQCQARGKNAKGPLLTTRWTEEGSILAKAWMRLATLAHRPRIVDAPPVPAPQPRPDFAAIIASAIRDADGARNA